MHLSKKYIVTFLSTVLLDNRSTQKDTRRFNRLVTTIPLLRAPEDRNWAETDEEKVNIFAEHHYVFTPMLNDNTNNIILEAHHNIKI